MAIDVPVSDYTFETGVWAFAVDAPLEMIQVNGPSSVLITDEDPWPKPPPPPPPMFKNFHEYSKLFDVLEAKVNPRLKLA